MAIQDKKSFDIKNEFSKEKIENLFLFTVNHKTAPISIREKFSIPEYRLKDAINSLKTYDLSSFLILSTCNRTEIYFTNDSQVKGLEKIYDFLSKFLNIEKKVIKEYNSSLENSSVIEHSFKLACGLDSLVMGEKQILSQVRFAYSIAQAEKTLDNTLEHLFQNIINTAKDIHKETNLSKNCQSISSAAIDMANKMCGLKTKSVMVLGAGKMAELALDHIEEIGGAKETIVLNRSPHRVIEFSSKYKIDKTIPFDDVYQSINETDVIVAATGAPHFILFAEQFKKTRKDTTKPLYVFDISLPRNIDPEFGKLENITLVDIDSLQSFYHNHNKIQDEVMNQVDEIISTGINEFYSEISNKDISELLKNLKAKVNSTVEEKLNKLKGNKNTFSSEELDYIVQNITNTILHEPIKNLKESNSFELKSNRLQTFKDLFQI